MLDYIYRVSFIGHRQVEHFRDVEEQLTKIVKDLIRSSVSHETNKHNFATSCENDLHPSA